jgi:hypothetical protein
MDLQAVEQAMREAGPGKALDLLAEKLLEEKNYSLLFDARLLRKRHEMGLELLPHGPLSGLSEDQRKVWDATLTEAAREAGALFLESGQIDRAFPYYRALGDLGPVKEAIEQVQPGERLDAAIEVAFGNQVHPRKGFELILANHGICRAITCFEQIQDPEARADSLRLLARTLHSELSANLRRAIETREGDLPETLALAALVEGREWLFGEYDYYIDTSHLLSVIRYATETEDVEVLRLSVDMCAYGARLGSMFQHPGEPPFENFYLDHSIYLRALMGEDVDSAISHFRKVAAYDSYETGTYPAQVLVRFLLKLKRYREAVSVSEEFLKDTDPQYLTCPTTIQLCQLAGDWDALRRVASAQGDAIGFTAALLHAAGPV